MNKNPSSSYKVRFNDCDLFGHLNNARYLDYLINAREDHLKDYYSFDFNGHYKNDLAWVVGTHEIAYLRPAVYNEIVTIQSTLLQADQAFVHVEMIMMNETQNHLKAIMRTKFIPVSIKTGKKTEHQQEFMAWAKTLENSEVAQQENLQGRINELLSAFKALKNT